MECRCQHKCLSQRRSRSDCMALPLSFCRSGGARRRTVPVDVQFPQLRRREEQAVGNPVPVRHRNDRGPRRQEGAHHRVGRQQLHPGGQRGRGWSWRRGRRGGRRGRRGRASRRGEVAQQDPGGVGADPRGSYERREGDLLVERAFPGVDADVHARQLAAVDAAHSCPQKEWSRRRTARTRCSRHGGDRDCHRRRGRPRGVAPSQQGLVDGGRYGDRVLWEDGLRLQVRKPLITWPFSDILNSQV